MDFNTAIVFTVGGIIGSILVTQMWQMNYFKRENFKFNQQMKRKENNINFKKIERDLGLKESRDLKPEPTITQDLINKGIDLYLGKGEEEDLEPEENDITTEILKYAKENPEIAKKFISKLGIGNAQEGNPQEYSR